MSETIYEYTIRYVADEEILDYDNYNNLVNALYKFLTEFDNLYSSTVIQHGGSVNWEKYREYVRELIDFKVKYNADKYRAAFYTPVYTYHYYDLAMILKKTCLAFNHCIEMLANLGFDYPDYLLSKLYEAGRIAHHYPEIKRGEKVYASHHNDVLRMLALLYQLILYPLNKPEFYLTMPKFEPSLYDRGIFLFTPEQWSLAKNFIDDGTVVIIKENLPNVSPAELLDQLYMHNCIIVNAIHTAPFLQKSMSVFLNILYTVDPIPSNGAILSIQFEYVVYRNRPCLGDYLPQSVPFIYDSLIDYYYKNLPQPPWAYAWTECWETPRDTGYCESWKPLANGYLFEMPFEGFWTTVDLMYRYMMTFATCFLEVSKPYRIIYLGTYTSDYPNRHEIPYLDLSFKALSKTYCDTMPKYVFDMRV